MNEKNNQLIKEMQSKLEFLRQQYETIKDYPDQSLFFQNSQILEAWMDLSVILAEFERLDLKELHEKESKKDDGDEVIKYALTLYRLKNSIYRQIMDYDYPIRSILNSYKDNLFHIKSFQLVFEETQTQKDIHVHCHRQFL